MTSHLQTGFLGEQVAADFLSALGFTILDRNARFPFGEIDIVARCPRGTLVFVEVKTLNHPISLSPEDNLTRSKFRKLSRTCSAYANAHPDFVNDSLGWRIDLVAITIDPLFPLPSGSQLFSFGKNNFAVSHYENIS